MNREKAIEIVQRIRKDYDRRVYTDDMDTTIRICTEIEALEKAVDVMKNTPEWINCDERLPENDVLVITLIFGHDVIVVEKGETLQKAFERINSQSRTSVGFYSEEDGGWCTVEGYPEICTPRCWMPFPKAPDRSDLK